MSEVENMVDAIEKLVDKKIANAMRGGTSTVPATYMGTDSEGKAWVVLAGADAATPVRRTSVEAARGDMVSVTVSDGMAVIDANLTDKSAGVASVAKADEKAVVAQETAVEAIDYASQASAAAGVAQSSASAAYAAAQTAQASADSAVADAARANEAATQAISDAATAHDAADSAQESADKATYALSDVERVVGTVNWIAEHGRYEMTDDTAVDDSKVYYTRSGSGTTADPYVYAVVAEPKASELSTYYELHIEESVQNFINSHVWLTQDGLYIGTQGAGYKTRVDADSLDILDEVGEVVATFGETMQVGRDGESHVELDYRSLQLVDKDGNTYFHVSDLRGVDGIFEATDSFEGEGNKSSFQLMFRAVSTDYTVAVNGVEVTSGVVKEESRFLFSGNPPADGDAVTATYRTSDSAAKAYTLGIREEGSAIGAMSLAEGRENVASGAYSHAEGYNVSASAHSSHAEGTDTKAVGHSAHAEGEYTTASASSAHAEGYGATASGTQAHGEGVETTASGKGAHSEGNKTEASGRHSHAENFETVASGIGAHAEGRGSTASGNYSHAEGDSTVAEGIRSHAEGYYTVAAGEYSHVEGSNSTASGNCSHAQNVGTTAASDYQTALGKFNVEDADGDYAVIVGNGADDSNRSNALTVDWDGNVGCGSTVDMTAPDASPITINTSSNNGCSESSPLGYINLLDKNGYWGALFGARANDNGVVYGMLGAQNKKTDGTDVENYINVGVNKDGSRYYAVTDPAAFRSAIGGIGTRKSIWPSSAVSCANNTWVEVASVSLEPGVWIVTYGGAFASNATGHRKLYIGTSASGVGRSSPTAVAVNGEQTRFSAVTTYAPTSTTTYNLYANQNSGGALNFFPYIQAVKVG